MSLTEKDSQQVEFFRNRVAKNQKILRRWARREAVTAYRLYDKDIPEIPLAMDWYREVDWGETGKKGKKGQKGKKGEKGEKASQL